MLAAHMGRLAVSRTTGLLVRASVSSRSFAHVASSKDGKINYNKSCLTKWRADLQANPELISSRGKPCSYTDDEIVAWRLEFDDYSESVITKENFKKKIAKKFPKLSGADLEAKIETKWARFDLDGNNVICFSEFCIVAYCIDVERLADQLSEDGVSEVFAKYAKDGVMQESCVKQLMQDYKFTSPIDADVRKLVLKMDANKDGKVCESDFKAFVKTEQCPVSSF